MNGTVINFYAKVKYLTLFQFIFQNVIEDLQCK